MTMPDPLSRLVAAHPLLFKGSSPLTSWVPPGWYELLDGLCRNITAALPPDDFASFEILQIKEKFGGLRFYWRLNGAQDVRLDILAQNGSISVTEKAQGGPASMVRIRNLERAAQDASQSICQECGAPASRANYGGYIATLCNVHGDELKAERVRLDAEHDDDATR